MRGPKESYQLSAQSWDPQDPREQIPGEAREELNSELSLLPLGCKQQPQVLPAHRPVCRL